MDKALRAKILDLLAAQHLMTLATIRSDGYANELSLDSAV